MLQQQLSAVSTFPQCIQSPLALDVLGWYDGFHNIRLFSANCWADDSTTLPLPASRGVIEGEAPSGREPAGRAGQTSGRGGFIQRCAHPIGQGIPMQAGLGGGSRMRLRVKGARIIRNTGDCTRLCTTGLRCAGLLPVSSAREGR